MATSGTATFNLDLTEVVEEAFERVGSELRTGYDLKTARRSLNLLFADWANRGINMWTIEQASVALVAGTATYSLPADTVDVMDAVIRTTVDGAQSDITISRISVSTYATIPNKTATGRPIQFLVNRTATPSVTLWLVPDASTTYTFAYWRLRRIQDAGDGVNTMDVPFRFLNALTAGLAWYIGLKKPETCPLERLNELKLQYDAAWATASDEDREKASARFVPRRSF